MSTASRLSLDLENRRKGVKSSGEKTNTTASNRVFAGVQIWRRWWASPRFASKPNPTDSRPTQNRGLFTSYILERKRKFAKSTSKEKDHPGTDGRPDDNSVGGPKDQEHLDNK